MGELKIEAVLRKVRALRALAQSSNVHEAEAAAAMAEGLIAKYRLEEAEVSAGAEPEEAVGQEVEPLDHEGRRRVVWRSMLACSLARHYGCSSWLRETERSSGLDRVVVGRPSDVAALRYMLAWLVAEITRLSQRESGRAGRNAFCVGAVGGFVGAIKRARAAADAAHSAAHGGSAAMVLASRERESLAHRNRLNPDLVTIPLRPTVSDGGAFGRGKAAGERLHGQGAARPLAAGSGRLLGSGS